MSGKPERIQRKRTKGWKMPPNTVYVGRPSDWGNAFKIGEGMTREMAVSDHANMVRNSEFHKAFAYQFLRGKNLACWCKLTEPCHADVLLEIANA